MRGVSGGAAVGSAGARDCSTGLGGMTQRIDSTNRSSASISWVPSPVPSARAIVGLLRYLIAGGVVFVVYVTLTLVLSGPVGVAIQVAIPVAYVLAVACHFVLQRRFVFAGQQFALRLHEQLVRYVAIGAIQYPVTALATAVLPDVLDVSEQVVYVAVTAVISATGFLVLRYGVFHAQSVSDDAPPGMSRP